MIRLVFLFLFFVSFIVVLFLFYLIIRRRKTNYHEPFSSMDAKYRDDIKKKYNLSHDKVYNGKKWHDYRLGDVVRWRESPHYSSLMKETKNRFPGSIAALYCQKTAKTEDFDTLYSIIMTKLFDPFRSPPDTCSIHLRLGDVYQQDNSFYFHPLNYYRRHVIPVLSKKKIRHVTIVAGAHHPYHLEGSLDYIVRLIELLTLHAIQVKNVRLGGSPDEDFVFMCSSRYFIQSGGGFSIVIAQMVKKNKGIVLNTW